MASPSKKSDLTKYHPVVARIIRLLEKEYIAYEAFEHEAVLTSEQAAAIRPEYSLHQGAKALIVKFKKPGQEGFVMLVLPGDCRFDNKKIRNLLGTKDFRFATAEEVKEVTGGVLPGGVPPFGHLFGLETYADPKIFKNEKIIFNAGDRRFSIAIKSADFTRLAKPKITAFILE